MNNRILLSIVFLVCFFNSSCTSVRVVDSATETRKTVHRTGAEIKNINVFLNKNKIIVKYVSKVYTRENNRTVSSDLNIEAVYDTDQSIPLKNYGSNIFLMKPSEYHDSHTDYRNNSEWIELPVHLEVSKKINKYSSIYDLAPTYKLELYRDNVMKRRAEKEAYNSLINNVGYTDTAIMASIIPSADNNNASKNLFNRRAVFIDTRNENKKVYVMMMPAYIVTSGHSNKAKFILLPFTAAFDVVTAPVQIMLLHGLSKIGN